MISEAPEKLRIGDRVRVKADSEIADLLPRQSGVVIATGVAMLNIELDGGGFAIVAPATKWELETGTGSPP